MNLIQFLRLRYGLRSDRIFPLPSLVSTVVAGLELIIFLLVIAWMQERDARDLAEMEQARLEANAFRAERALVTCLNGGIVMLKDINGRPVEGHGCRTERISTKGMSM